MNFAQFINQNSYWVITSFGALIALVVVLVRFRRSRVGGGALALLVVLIVAGNFLLRVGASEIETAAQFDQIVASNSPVVLEFYSNY